jgi:hypothetical protein
MLNFNVHQFLDHILEMMLFFFQAFLTKMKLLLLVVLFCLVFVCGAAPDGEVAVAKERDLIGDLTIILLTVLSLGKNFYVNYF